MIPVLLISKDVVRWQEISYLSPQIRFSDYHMTHNSLFVTDSQACCYTLSFCLSVFHLFTCIFLHFCPLSLSLHLYLFIYLLFCPLSLSLHLSLLYLLTSVPFLFLSISPLFIYLHFCPLSLSLNLYLFIYLHFCPLSLSLNLYLFIYLHFCPLSLSLNLYLFIYLHFCQLSLSLHLYLFHLYLLRSFSLFPSLSSLFAYVSLPFLSLFPSLLYLFTSLSPFSIPPSLPLPSVSFFFWVFLFFCFFALGQ